MLDSSGTDQPVGVALSRVSPLTIKKKSFANLVAAEKSTAADVLKCICGPYFTRLLPLQFLHTFTSLLEEEYLNAVLCLLGKLLFSRSSGCYST